MSSRSQVQTALGRNAKALKIYLVGSTAQNAKWQGLYTINTTTTAEVVYSASEGFWIMEGSSAQYQEPSFSDGAWEK